MTLIRKLIPTFLKYPLMFSYVTGKLLARGRVGKGIILNLAGALPPIGSKRIIHGGKPKLLPLRERFGDTWRHFNIAYFASSSLPFAPTIWLKLYHFFGVKIAWNQNGFAYPALYEKSIVKRINNLMQNLHLSDFVIYQTEFTKHCADKFVGNFTGPYAIIINPVDTKKFRPGVEILSEPITIIMAGNHFESQERLKVSLEALRIVRKTLKIKLLVIGKPDFKIPDEEWIENIGPFTQAEAPTLYRRAHLLLHLKYLDPCPTVVLEALATGLPVVGQANGGVPELVGEAGVLLSVPEDFENLHYPLAKEVADAIKKALDNREVLSNIARNRALLFDKEKWLDRHEQIFHELLK